MNLIEIINHTPLIKQWHEQLEQQAKRQLLVGLSGSAKALVMAGAYEKYQRQIIIVVPNLYYSNQLAEELRQVMDDVYLFPVDEVLSAEMAFSSPEARAERVETLTALSQGKKVFMLCPQQLYANIYQHQQLGKTTSCTGKSEVKLIYRI